MSEAQPTTRSSTETRRKVLSRLVACSDLGGGEMKQNARMAERNIITDQSGADQPILPVSGDSLTIRTPMNNSDRVRTMTWRRVFQRASPLFSREPSANGMDMPTMKRKAGKTRSTNVMPL